jgi:hypothetical protein
MEGKFMINQILTTNSISTVTPSMGLVKFDAERNRESLRDALIKNIKFEVNPGGTEMDKRQSGSNDHPRIFIPEGILAYNQEEESQRKRKALRESLSIGETTYTSPTGVVNKEGQQGANALQIPEGILACNQLRTNDEEATREVTSIKGEDVESQGNPGSPNQQLANLIYQAPEVPGQISSWYERNPKLLEAEIASMAHFFPGFRLEKMNDGRLCWRGTFYPTNLRTNARWDLKVVYQHFFPDKNNYGGPVRVYCEYPDLEELARTLGGSIPYTSRDEAGKYFLSLGRTKDTVPGMRVPSATTDLYGSIKWISLFEFWLTGRISTAELVRAANK